MQSITGFQKVRKNKILILMKNSDCLFSDIQNLCNAESDWLIKKTTTKKSILQLKPTRQYPVPVVTSCVITAEPVNKRSNSINAFLSSSESVNGIFLKYILVIHVRIHVLVHYYCRSINCSHYQIHTFVYQPFLFDAV